MRERTAQVQRTRVVATAHSPLPDPQSIPATTGMRPLTTASVSVPPTMGGVVAFQQHGGNQAVQRMLLHRRATALTRPSATNPMLQRWPTELPVAPEKMQAFASLEEYFRAIARLSGEQEKEAATALLNHMFFWRSGGHEPYELREDEIPKAKELQAKLGLSQGDWAGLVFEGRARLLGSPRKKEGKAIDSPKATKLDTKGIIKEVDERIKKENANAKTPKFRLLYNEEELVELVFHAAKLGIEHQECIEILLIGCRCLKPRSAEQLKDQMFNLKMIVEARGVPFKFDHDKALSSREYLRDLSNRLIELIDGMTLFGQTIPSDDVRIQGSSLRTPLAEDVDIAVFVSEATFAALCLNRYKGRIKLRDEKKILDIPADYAGLVKLAEHIRANPKQYSNDSGSFADMLLGGKFDGKTKSADQALVNLTATIAGEFKPLNIESVTILVRGGPFDLKPYMLIKKD